MKRLGRPFVPVRTAAALVRTREPNRAAIIDAVRSDITEAQERTYQVTVRALLGLALEHHADDLAHLLEREIATFVAGERPELDTSAAPETGRLQRRWGRRC